MSDFEIFHQQLQKYNGKEQHVVIPEGITSIKDYAFYNCQSIKTITIPDTVTEIGDHIFYDCENIERVTIPDSVAFLGDAIFNRCKNLKYVKLSDRLTSLNKIVFYQCEHLEDVILPKNLRTIGRSCFEQCHQLKKIVLPDSVKVIQDNAFDDCTSLKRINTPQSLEKIGHNVFFNCHELRQFVIPQGIKEIGAGAFETRGYFSLISDDDFLLHASCFDNNWNMNWNFGQNKRFNGKNEDNYQLYYSYLPKVDFKEWKDHAKVILCINFLETLKTHKQEAIDLYQPILQAYKNECLSLIIDQERYTALHHALDKELLSTKDLEPYFGLIKDREQKAKIMNSNKEEKSSIDDLFNLL